MIRIHRDRCDDSGNPIRPAGDWAVRASEWTDRAIHEARAHHVQPTVYGDDRVRAALEQLCDGKCVYCEAPVPASSSWDVEHYRPKGRVSERLDHPGYYWLAYTWTNLLLSCEFCNRRRTDRPTWEQSEAGGPSGKADRFPLGDEGTRAMGPDDDLNREDRLLIDPTQDDPEDHIVFDATGRAVPRDGSVVGATSIDLCHLNRRRLVDRRRTQIELVVRMIEGLTGDGRCSVGEALEAVCDQLGRPQHPWAATARTIRRDPAAFGLRGG